MRGHFKLFKWKERREQEAKDANKIVEAHIWNGIYEWVKASYMRDFWRGRSCLSIENIENKDSIGQKTSNRRSENEELFEGFSFA